jgi:hypothetical protein
MNQTQQVDCVSHTQFVFESLIEVFHYILMQSVMINFGITTKQVGVVHANVGQKYLNCNVYLILLNFK